MHAPVSEPDARARDKVLHRARYDNLAPSGPFRHPSADVHGDPVDVISNELDLACVQPCSDLNPKGLDGVRDGTGTVDRSCGPIKGGKKPIARESNHPPSVMLDLSPYNLVMGVHKDTPGAIPKRDYALSRANDIGAR
jgi:hypothetical protein